MLQGSFCSKHLTRRIRTGTPAPTTREFSSIHFQVRSYQERMARKQTFHTGPTSALHTSFPKKIYYSIGIRVKIRRGHVAIKTVGGDRTLFSSKEKENFSFTFDPLSHLESCGRSENQILSVRKACRPQPIFCSWQPSVLSEYPRLRAEAHGRLCLLSQRINS